MFHGLGNSFLYSAVNLVAKFEDSLGKKLSVSGTGFFTKVDDSIQLITNRHVLEPAYSKEKYKNFSLKVLGVVGRLADEEVLDCRILPEKGRFLVSTNDLNDIACVLDFQIETMGPAKRNISLNFYIHEEMIAERDVFENDLSVCDFVAFPGYPDWHDKISKRPILRTGTIASDPRFDYSHKKVMGECVAYEAFSYDGSSGSPIFSLQKGIKPGSGITFEGFRPVRFIGINAGHLPSASSSHSGISYFYKSSAILETIRSGKNL